jgi:predicted NBD/HSP70 family sugar kinase
VAGGYDEDEEGLEFLGIEEASREPQRREPRPQDDELFAESGLDQVRDVPSWVEAIGIVIAGNLDARSRSRGGDGGRRDR